MIVCTDGEVDSEVIATVALTVQQVRACYGGPVLERARVLATFTAYQVSVLFPGRAIVHARNLRRIGKRLRTERVRLALATAPTRVLLAAARFTTEDAQLSAAIAEQFGLHL